MLRFDQDQKRPYDEAGGMARLPWPEPPPYGVAHDTAGTGLRVGDLADQHRLGE